MTKQTPPELLYEIIALISSLYAYSVQSSTEKADQQNFWEECCALALDDVGLCHNLWQYHMDEVHMGFPFIYPENILQTSKRLSDRLKLFSQSIRNRKRSLISLLQFCERKFLRHLENLKSLELSDETLHSTLVLHHLKRLSLIENLLRNEQTARTPHKAAVEKNFKS